MWRRRSCRSRLALFGSSMFSPARERTEAQLNRANMIKVTRRTTQGAGAISMTYPGYRSGPLPVAPRNSKWGQILPASGSPGTFRRAAPNSSLGDFSQEQALWYR